MLNPVLGRASWGVGADIDLIVGDCFVEIKTSVKSELQRDHYRQILAYLLMGISAGYEYVNHVGIYFARHGWLWKIDASKMCTRNLEQLASEFIELMKAITGVKED